MINHYRERYVQWAIQNAGRMFIHLNFIDLTKWISSKTVRRYWIYNVLLSWKSRFMLFLVFIITKCFAWNHFVCPYKLSANETTNWISTHAIHTWIINWSKISLYHVWSFPSFKFIWTINIIILDCRWKAKLQRLHKMAKL